MTAHDTGVHPPSRDLPRPPHCGILARVAPGAQPASSHTHVGKSVTELIVHGGESKINKLMTRSLRQLTCVYTRYSSAAGHKHPTPRVMAVASMHT